MESKEVASSRPKSAEYCLWEFGGWIPESTCSHEEFHLLELLSNTHCSVPVTLLLCHSLLPSCMLAVLALGDSARNLCLLFFLLTLHGTRVFERCRNAKITTKKVQMQKLTTMKNCRPPVFFPLKVYWGEENSGSETLCSNLWDGAEGDSGAGFCHRNWSPHSASCFHRYISHEQHLVNTLQKRWGPS